MIKGLVLQEHIMFLNVYPRNRASQTVTAREKMDKRTIRVGNFNTFISMI